MAVAKTLKIPAIKITQGKYELYGFAIGAKKLWKLTQINRKELDKEAGYQRALSDARRKTIAEYIDAGNTIPNAILVVFDDKDVKFDAKANQLILPDKKNIGWVIDGQHRLAGAEKAKTDIDIFVLAFLNLELAEQVRQFVVVNREAKGVPTSLYIDLLKSLPDEKTEAERAKERANDINTALRRDPDSIFYNRIVFGAPKKGQMSLTNFVRKIAPFVSVKGKFNLYSLDEQRGIIHNYFKALENIFPAEFSENKMSFFNTLNFGAIINVLPTVFDLAQKHYLGFRVEDAGKVLKTIDDFEFADWAQYGTGSSAEILAGADFTSRLLSRMEDKGKPGSLRL